MYTYDQPIQISYRFAALTLSAAATIGRLSGPSGRSGRVLGITGVVTTGTTVAATLVTVDTVAGLTTPASVSVPVLSANAVFGSTQANTEGADELPADTEIILVTDGGCTAGAADVTVTVGWY